MDMNDKPAPAAAASAAGGGREVTDPPAPDAAARAREIAELEFLVGTACSRAINLLMRSDRDPAELADELAFLGEKATRLAALLRGSAGDDAGLGGPGVGVASGD